MLADQANQLAKISPEKRAKIVMIEKGIKPADIARGLGLSVSYIYRLLSGAIVTKKGRCQIERFLGTEVWSVSPAGLPTAGQSEVPTPT